MVYDAMDIQYVISVHACTFDTEILAPLLEVSDYFTIF